MAGRNFHRRHVRRNRRLQPPARRLGVGLAFRTVGSGQPRHFKPRMTLQHLDKPLPNHAGSAQNPDRKFIAHKKVFRFYNSSLRKLWGQHHRRKAQSPKSQSLARPQAAALVTAVSPVLPMEIGDYHARAAPKFLYQGMGHHRHRACQAPRRVGYTSRPQSVPSFVETCPFCPGNESKTPPEVLRFPANASEPWAVRVIPNKFAALNPATAQPTRSRAGRLAAHRGLRISRSHHR